MDKSCRLVSGVNMDMSEAEATEFLQKLREAIGIIASESAKDLYKQTAILGAARALARKFGTAEVGLAKELQYLLDESSDWPAVRNKLAFEWMQHRMLNMSPAELPSDTTELAEVLFRIDHFAHYPPAAS